MASSHVAAPLQQEIHLTCYTIGPFLVAGKTFLLLRGLNVTFRLHVTAALDSRSQGTFSEQLRRRLEIRDWVTALDVRDWFALIGEGGRLEKLRVINKAVKEISLACTTNEIFFIRYLAYWLLELERRRIHFEGPCI